MMHQDIKHLDSICSSLNQGVIQQKRLRFKLKLLNKCPNASYCPTCASLLSINLCINCKICFAWRRSVCCCVYWTNTNLKFSSAQDTGWAYIYHGLIQDTR